MAYSYDSIFIVACAFAGAVLTEVISWLVIYRSEDYTRLRGELDRAEKKLQSLQKTGQGKSKKKREQRAQGNAKAFAQELSFIKTKSYFVTGILVVIMYQALTTLFDGVVVAKLPFEPFAMARGITHRNLAGTDYTDCSGAFIYVLCTAGVRMSVTRFFGFAPNRSLQQLGTNGLDSFIAGATGNS